MHIVAKTFEIYFLAKISSISLVNQIVINQKAESVKFQLFSLFKGQHKNFLNNFHQGKGNFYSVFLSIRKIWPIFI